MSTVEEIIDKQFAEFVLKFRPVFGNQAHIFLAHDISILNKMEKELQVKLDNAKGGQTLQKEIRLLKRRVLKDLKQIV